MIVRLVNNDLARMLHYALFKRMVEFAERINPEIPAAPMVEGWLERLYKGDERLHILVNLDDHYTIIEHAVIDVHTVGGRSVVVGHQVFRDRPNLDTLRQGLRYIDQLRRETQAVCSALYMQKHSKALEREGYKVAQVLMIKCASDEEAEAVVQDTQLQAALNGV